MSIERTRTEKRI